MFLFFYAVFFVFVCSKVLGFKNRVFSDCSNRNRRIAPSIRRIFQTNGYFSGVGAEFVGRNRESFEIYTIAIERINGIGANETVRNELLNGGRWYERTKKFFFLLFFYLFLTVYER